MSFTLYEKLEEMAVSNENTYSSFHKEIIADYIEKEKRKTGMKEKPFIYFYEDVISSTLSFNFQSVFDDNTYRNASGDATSCLNICDDFRKLSAWSVNGWLQNALKFADNIVLHYIQDCCKEIPRKYNGLGIEKSRYKHLSEKKEEDQRIAGSLLLELYDTRNKLEHRTITYQDGRQELKRPPLNNFRRDVVKNFPSALKRMLKIYKLSYPDYVV